MYLENYYSAYVNFQSCFMKSKYSKYIRNAMFVFSANTRPRTLIKNTQIIISFSRYGIKILLLTNGNPAILGVETVQGHTLIKSNSQFSS